ncbi:MAG: hypothetical protein J3K34DRAFT_526135 [Monoraphidium minutum]|nr:MAG: hypothetical protein J3K34DRAFT_526135 [Monoraphidium minutum]
MVGPYEMSLIAKYFGAAHGALLLRAGALAAGGSLNNTLAPRESESDLITRFFADKSAAAAESAGGAGAGRG